MRVIFFSFETSTFFDWELVSPRVCGVQRLDFQIFEMEKSEIAISTQLSFFPPFSFFAFLESCWQYFKTTAVVLHFRTTIVNVTVLNPYL